MITLREYEAGETILRQGEDGDTAYTIVTGRVHISRNLHGETIDLGTLGPGEIFGEMGMIDDRPRSATVTATEPTTIREVHRETFLESMQSHPETGVDLLRAIFERLRQAHVTIAKLQSHLDDDAPSRPGDTTAGATDTPIRIAGNRIWLEGATEHATKSLPAETIEIDRFPFRIGRKTRDPLAHNDLSLADEEPLQISRHHVSLIDSDGRLGIVDRGSHLGGQVEGEPLGGATGYPGPIYLTKPESLLILGGPTSPYHFKVRIEPADGPES